MSNLKKIMNDNYSISDRQFLRLIARQFSNPADAQVRERLFEIADKVSDCTKKEVRESYNEWCRENGQFPGG